MKIIFRRKRSTRSIIQRFLDYGELLSMVWQLSIKKHHDTTTQAGIKDLGFLVRTSVVLDFTKPCVGVCYVTETKTKARNKKPDSQPLARIFSEEELKTLLENPRIHQILFEVIRDNGISFEKNKKGHGELFLQITGDCAKHLKKQLRQDGRGSWELHQSDKNFVFDINFPTDDPYGGRIAGAPYYATSEELIANEFWETKGPGNYTGVKPTPRFKKPDYSNNRAFYYRPILVPRHAL